MYMVIYIRIYVYKHYQYFERGDVGDVTARVLSGAGNCVDSNPFPSNLSINLCDIEEAKFTIQSHHWLW